jgi:NADH dehydrogenase
VSPHRRRRNGLGSHRPIRLAALRSGLYVIGDLARALDHAGNPLPGLAQVAKQQGIHLGRALARRILKQEPVPAFRYRNRGNTAVIGRKSAIFDFGFRQMKGMLAWFLWALIHVYLLVGFEHRAVVSVQWLWRYFTYERGARLILDESAAQEARAAAREKA